jgi:exopolysaccharide production protein ExoQ
MSTTCAISQSSVALYDTGDATRLPQWHIWLTALVVGLVFFLTEHSLDISLADAYTQTLDEMEVTALGGNTVRRVAFLILAAFGIWLLAVSKQPLNINPWLALPMGLYLLMAGGSYFWSVDPGMCLRRLVIVGCCAAAALGIARRLSMHELCLLTVAIIGPLVAIGLLSELRLGTFRPWSGDYRFSGSVHPNTQNMHLTALALAALGVARANQRWRGVLLGVFAACLVLSVLTKSRTGNAATILAISSVFIIQTPFRPKVIVGLAGFWAVLVALWLIWICGYDPLNDFRDALLLGRAEESDTLSGRSFIWPLVWYFVSKRPVLGYGYESFWNPTNIDIVSEDLQWAVREAHNGYLDILLSTGFVGLACAIAAILAGLAAATSGKEHKRDPAYALPLGMLVFGLVTSVMESGMVGIMLPPIITGCCLTRMALFENQSPQEGAPR